MFSSENWFGAEASFYNGVATQSLRLNDDDSAYLYRTPSSASNRKTYTFSCWYKRANLSGVNQVFLSAGGGGSDFTMFYIDAGSNRLSWYDYDGSTDYGQNLSIVLRDTSAWYHLVFAVDTTQATDTNRVKIYVNGTLQTSVGADYGLFPQDMDTSINNNQQHNIAKYRGANYYIDGYMAEVNFVDGTQLAPTSFGETKNGVWIPKAYTGSYGTNGFRLQFNQTGVGTASALTIGADTSGNTHHFTSSGIVASDCAMPDSPENNFATIDPLSSGAGVFSEGNLKYVSTADTGNTTFGISSGKVYAEVYVSSVSNSFIGVLDIRNLSPTRGGNFTSHGAIAYKQNGDQYSLPVGGSSATASYGASYTNGDIIGIALNVDDDTITFYKNGSSQSATTNGVSHISSNGVYGFLLYASGTNFICNFGQDSSFAGNKTAQGNTDGNGIGDFYYAPPSGYLALCTSNLPEPTIGPNSGTNKQADDYFNTVLYNGNGGTQSITDVGFQSDWVWIKNRNGTGIHGLFDSSRGATKYLSSNSLDDEATASGVTSFDSKGFSLGSAFNQSSLTFVAWNWKANGDTTSTNDDGSIQSTVQANTDAGFSIVQYVATGSNATVGHGLSVEPDTVWIKNRDTDNRHWMSYWKPLGNTDRMIFNTGATASTSTSFNNTSPTSTVFSIGTSAHVNDASDNYIAYCFHSVEGYSKIGSYTGNGSTNGTFVYTGFEISFLMVKRAVGGTGDYSSWAMYDNKRKTINSDVGTDSNPLFANRSSQEGIRGNGSLSISGTRTAIDFLSNGFKLRDVANEIGVSGNTYIYMAFAKNPFKYANAK